MGLERSPATGGIPIQCAWPTCGCPGNRADPCAGGGGLMRMQVDRRDTPSATRRIEAIYVASRKKHAHMIRMHRDCGVPIISTWIDAVDSGRIPKPTQKEIWHNAFEEIGRCSAFIFHDGGRGAHIELGIALGMGVERVIVTGPSPEWQSITPLITTLGGSLAEAYELAVQNHPGGRRYDVRCTCYVTPHAADCASFSGLTKEGVALPLPPSLQPMKRRRT